MIKLLHFGENKEAVPLVSIPGIDGSIGSIKPLVDGISKYREVIVVDYTEAKNATIDSLAEEIYEKVKSELEQPFHLSGQSIGSIVAAKLDAKDLPTQKVVLTCTFTKLSVAPLKISTFFMKISPDWLYRLTSKPTMRYVCGPVGDGEAHPFFEASRNSNKNDIVRRTMWQIDADFSSDLRNITSPLLIMMGEKDRFVPDAANEIQKLRNLFQHREDCCIQVVSNAGHVFLPSKSIEIATKIITQFLE